MKDVKLSTGPIVMYSTKQLLVDLFFYLHPFRVKFFCAVIFRLVSDIVWLYPFYALSQIVNFFSHYEQGDSLANFWKIFLMWIIAALLYYSGHYFSKFLGFRMAEQTNSRARILVLKHLFSLDLHWHEKENAGNKIKRIEKGAEGLNRILRMVIANVIEISVNFVGMTWIVGSIDRVVGLCLVVFLSTYSCISIYLLKKAHQASQLVDMKDEEIHGLAFEGMNNIRSVKVLGMAGPLFEIIEKNIKEYVRRIYKRIFFFQTRGIVQGIWSQSWLLISLVVIVFGIINGKYEVGFLVLFMGYFRRIIESLNELSEVSQDFVVAKFGVGRMQSIMNEKINIDNDEGKVNFPTSWKKISLRDVSFAYDQDEVLRHISLDIYRGEKVGIVGLSGAGKSTLFKLLLKEIENYSGEILIDNIPLKNIKRSDYFHYSAVVLQETEVFNFTLEQNITLANKKKEKNSQLVDRALAIAHVSDFLQKFPLGKKTVIGEKGIKLSGGEKQRLGIARAVFKEPQLLFLDEATSHLDIESEEKIQDSLHQFFQNVTAVVIAHRLTTLREMDRILVLEHGKIIEEGSFEELSAQKGRFFDLWEKQKL